MQINDFFDEILEGTTGSYVILRTGSSVLPWIKNPHDTDYLIFLNTAKDISIACDNFHKHIKDKPDNTCVMIQLNAKNIPEYGWWAYLLLFSTTIEGDKEMIYYYKSMKKAIETPTEATKKQIANDIYNNFYKVWCLAKNFDKNPKILYHVYIWKCLLEKGNLNLTKEEGEMVNNLHDIKFTGEKLNKIKQDIEIAFKKYL